MKKEITIWERWIKEEKKFKHNHISYGYDKNELILNSIFKHQSKVWKNAKWRKFKGYLEGGKVVYETTS